MSKGDHKFKKKPKGAKGGGYVRPRVQIGFDDATRKAVTKSAKANKRSFAAEVRTLVAVSLSKETRAATVEACAKCVPTNWCDPLLTGPGAPKGPLGNREVERLLRGVQDRIRALATPPDKSVTDPDYGEPDDRSA